MSNIFTKWKHLIPVEKSATGHQQLFEGGREWEDTYRDRWSFDKCVHSTHGVNCTGSCCWNIYVKNGLVAWENQEHNYPETSPDMPDFEPRGCPRGATFSWYLYSPHRVKYPYLRGELAALWREARKEHEPAGLGRPDGRAGVFGLVQRGLHHDLGLEHPADAHAGFPLPH